MKTTHSTPTETKTQGKEKAALDLLKADHDKVLQMFADFEETHTESKKQKLAMEICDALTVHAQVEEELFYPELQAALKDKGMVMEAGVEHAVLKTLIAQLEKGQMEKPARDATMKVLAEYTQHHIKEEQGDIFRAARQTDIDLQELGSRMAERFDSLRESLH